MSDSIPAPKPQRQARQRMAPEDARDLRAYFGGGGFARLEQSPIGHQLDALCRFGESRRCEVCGGLGVVPVTPQAESRAAKAAGKRRQLAAWGISLVSERARKIPKSDMPHLTEYRRLRDEEGDRVRAESYRREHAEDIRQDCDRESGARAREQEKWIRGEVDRIAKDERDGVAERSCLECRGTGWVGVTISHRRVTAKPTGSSVAIWGEDSSTGLGHFEGEGVCAGFDSGLDARPTGSSKHGEGGVDVGDVVLFTIGRIARRLARIELRDPRLVTALARFYAPQSGGALALWDLVPAGATLLKQRGPISAGMTPTQVYQEIAEQYRTTMDARLGQQLAAAREQAQELATRAHEAWRESEPTKTRKAVVPGAPRKPRIHAPRNAVLAQLADAVREALESAQ